MERQKVQSRTIRSIGYDPEARILEVELHDGKVYNYKNVPINMYVSLMKASSHEDFILQRIKPNYPYKTITYG